MCLFASCQLILFAKVQEFSIISLYLLVIIYTVIYLASPNESIRVLPTHLFVKLQEASIISLYLLVIIYTVICLASPNVAICVLPTHFICKGPGSFNNYIIPIIYYLHCNLSCFTQCVYIRVLATHFICKGPGSFHNFIIPISYYLHCNLPCFIQCAYSLFANSFYLQRSRKFP